MVGVVFGVVLETVALEVGGTVVLGTMEGLLIALVLVEFDFAGTTLGLTSLGLTSISTDEERLGS